MLVPLFAALCPAEDVLEDKLEESEDKEMILGEDILNPFTGGCRLAWSAQLARGRTAAVVFRLCT